MTIQTQNSKPKTQNSSKSLDSAQGKPASSIHSTSSGSRPAASMAELMAKAGDNLQVLTRGQTVEGTIKKLTPKEILMDIGAKGDALVIEFDKQNLENLLSFLKVGDKVKASVISPESEEGFPVLSLRRTLDDIIFQRFEELSRNDSAFDVDVVESTRGGYFAQNKEGIRGFLPASQASAREDGQDLVGQRIKVKILEFDQSKKRVLFSQKAMDYVMNPALLEKLVKKDQIVEGEITVVVPYGLFVALNLGDSKVEGFIHISEVSYERVEGLSDKFKVGDKVTAQVVEIDSANKRVNLSIKRTQKDAFQDVRSKYKLEDKVKGTVLDVKSKGVTLEVEKGIKGLIPSDKIPSGTTYEPNQPIEAEITGFDEKRRVILLSPVLKVVPIGYR